MFVSLGERLANSGYVFCLKEAGVNNGRVEERVHAPHPAQPRQLFWT